MEHGTETAVGQWSAPECPFQIEYSARVLDDIRLAVVDAFFSLPRGGAEIGGILLGKLDGGRLSITDYEALDCEHALGPSFTLSPRDQTSLAQMTAAARRNTAHRQPVGWYHSHTRSEIFLSATDRDIHNRFFPEPWQVALVLKPHTFQPTRGGFFFREPDGSVRGAASYREFQLDPLPLRPAPAAMGNNSTPAYRPLHEDSGSGGTLIEAPPEPVPAAADPPAAPSGKSKGRVPITREIAIDPPLADASNGRQRPADVAGPDAPDFGQMRQERSWRAVKAAAILAVGLAAGGVGYQTRQYWAPQVLAKARAVLPKEPDEYLSLTLSDDNGQLKIQWDRNAPAVRNALEATLEISDGNTVPQSVRLDNAHLAAGALSYAREHERVDVTLLASEPNGQTVKEQSSFLGKLPARKGTAGDPAIHKDRDAQAERADKLQKDLNFQAAKTRKLEKDLKDMREQMQNEQKGRSDNPTPDPTKKN
jgi:proteasome lid subunit RPN8/RPN11